MPGASGSIVVAQAEPMTPIAGAPRCPKISTQLSAMLARLATTMVITMGAVRRMACRLCRKTTNTKNGSTPGAIRMA